MEDNNSIFRKQSIESVSSPEQLDDYIRSAEPGVWLLLFAIIIFLAGVCIWGVFGKLDSNVTVGALCKGGQMSLYIPETDRDNVSPGMAFTSGGKTFVIDSVSDSPVMLGDETKNAVYIAYSKTDLPDGAYKAVITSGSFSPVSFITN